VRDLSRPVALVPRAAGGSSARGPRSGRGGHGAEHQHRGAGARGARRARRARDAALCQAGGPAAAPLQRPCSCLPAIRMVLVHPPGQPRPARSSVQGAGTAGRHVAAELWWQLRSVGTAGPRQAHCRAERQRQRRWKASASFNRHAKLTHTMCASPGQAARRSERRRRRPRLRRRRRRRRRRGRCRGRPPGRRASACARRWQRWRSPTRLWSWSPRSCNARGCCSRLGGRTGFREALQPGQLMQRGCGPCWWRRRGRRAQYGARACLPAVSLQRMRCRGPHMRFDRAAALAPPAQPHARRKCRDDLKECYLRPLRPLQMQMRGAGHAARRAGKALYGEANPVLPLYAALLQAGWSREDGSQSKAGRYVSATLC